jgi:hypothetical protein
MNIMKNRILYLRDRSGFLSDFFRQKVHVNWSWEISIGTVNETIIIQLGVAKKIYFKNINLL